MPQTDVPEDITRWVAARGIADADALRRLFSAMYDDLKRHAHFALARTSAAETLNTTALVNEAFLRLRTAEPMAINDQQHFLALAAKTMRWVLMDFARARKRLRRGSDAERVTLEEAMVMAEQRADHVLALDEALRRLADLDPRLVDVVELRVFGGFSTHETASSLGVSPRTVKRDWRAAKAFLAAELGGSDPMPGD